MKRENRTGREASAFFRFSRLLLPLLLLLPLFLILLTSCDVHFGTVHYDVPWWVIAVPVCLVSLAIWFAAGKYLSSHTYVCPGCSASFHPKWWAAGLSLRINGDRLFKCPYCKKRNFCRKEL